MLDRLAAHTHRLRIVVEASLHGLDDVLVFPAGNAPLLACRALILDRTNRARAGPIAAQVLSVFLLDAADFGCTELLTFGRETEKFLRHAHTDIPAVVEAMRQFWMPIRYASAG